MNRRNPCIYGICYAFFVILLLILLFVSIIAISFKTPILEIIEISPLNNALNANLGTLKLNSTVYNNNFFDIEMNNVNISLFLRSLSWNGNISRLLLTGYTKTSIEILLITNNDPRFILNECLANEMNVSLTADPAIYEIDLPHKLTLKSSAFVTCPSTFSTTKTIE